MVQQVAKSQNLVPEGIRRLPYLAEGRGDSSSSILERRYQGPTRSVASPALGLVDPLLLAVSISSGVRRVAITVMGVFNSWLASVMNCCYSPFTTGSMAFRK